MPSALATLAAALAASSAALLPLARADRNSFDCPMRSLAVEFSAYANPHLTAAQLQGIADALNGAPEKTPANCTVTVPSALLAARDAPRFRPFPVVPRSSAAGGATVYVSYAQGSDTNPGTQASPFKTLPRAVAATRAAGAGSSIVLRAGTHYLTDTLVLDARDSGLTVQAFPGEEPWISRATPLTNVQWAPHNTTGGGWQVFPGQNAVYGGTDSYPFAVNGTTDTWQECQALAQANVTAGGAATIFTWHSPNATGYENQCWFRLDGQWGPTAQADHVSGYLVPTPNVWVADLTALALPAPVVGLRAADGSRLIRARYPNANPEYGFGSGLSADGWTAPEATQKVQPEVEVRPTQPYRNSSYSFQYYQAGIGGICSVPGFGFDLTGGGYWCGDSTEGGGAFTWRTPYGMVTSNRTLPNLPYADPTTAIVQAWHPARWASRMYGIAGVAYDPSTGAANFSFSRGGYQDARGSDNAGNFYVENVMEELDDVSEWFFDAATNKLYLFYNASAGTPPPTDGSIAAVVEGAIGLINVTATQASPVAGLSFLGVGFRDTAYTYFEPHTIPSGGDWALPRVAAVQLEGTVDAVVDSCLFERLDGTALLVSGFNRNTQITRNDFAWIGGSAVVHWGRTTGDPTGLDGWDGTDGNQPRYTVYAFNYVHEVGIFEKQSSCLMQAKTSDSWIEGNMCFNGPRAGMNQNDGFGGNNTLIRNLIMNQCRESGDHGPFNSWDRQVFLTYKNGGSIQKDYDVLTQNFLLANFDSQEGIDNDDGSAYYNSSRNFMVYSGNGMKSDFGGHDNIHHDNVYAFIGRGFSICNQLEGHMDSFYNNKVIQTSDGDYGNPSCSDGPNNALTIVYNNSIFTPTGAVTECGMSLAAWQAKGNDPGTTAAPIPSDETILAFARAALGM